MIFLPFFLLCSSIWYYFYPFTFLLQTHFEVYQFLVSKKLPKETAQIKILHHFSQISVSISFNLHFWAFKKKCHEVFASQNIRQALRLTFTKKKWKLYQSDHVYHIWFCTLSVWVLIICNDKVGFFLCEL